MKKISAFLGIFLAIVSCIWFGVDRELFLEQKTAEEIKEITSDTLQVHFIDVGQGDAILIQKSGINTLLDTGEEKEYGVLKAYLDEVKVEKIHHLIITHPDSDHMGGADRVMEDYEIGCLYKNNFSKDTLEYKEMMSVAREKEIEIAIIKAESELFLGEGLGAKVLSPKEEYADSNGSSIVIRLDYGKDSFLFMGDATAKAEGDILQNGYDVKVEVLKVSHHGSDYSNGILFLKKASPKYAVISVGKDNKYGHPKNTVLRRLEKFGAEILRTDLKGTIVLYSNGDGVSEKPTAFYH